MLTGSTSRSRPLVFLSVIGMIVFGSGSLHAQSRAPAPVSAAEEPCDPECPPVPGVWVTPDDARAPTRLANTGDYTASFTVTNTGGATDDYSLSCEGELPVTCTGIGEEGVTHKFLVLDSGESATIEVFYDVGEPGVGRLILRAVSSVQDEGSYEVPVGRPSVDVTPDGAIVHLLGGRTSSETFTVRNTAGITVGVNISVSCEFPAVSCIPSSTRLVVPRDGEKTVDVQFYYVTGSMAGRLSLTASTDHGALQETGWVELRGGQAAAPTVNVDDVNPGETVARDQCLTIRAGTAAAYECGDLRIVHPLPTTTTLGKARTPTLVYNSQHAHPHPVVAALVQQDEGVARPDSVVATLKVDGVERAHGKWSGVAWVTGEPRRIALSFDALSDRTGAYDYALEVANWYGAQAVPRTVRSTLVIVNRSDSPFGAGWWLAGVERLYTGPRSGTLLWVGGEGSARVYERVEPHDIWVAPNVDRPDTLKLENWRLVRYLPHGLRVEFSVWGQHLSTVNRLNHETHFRYDGNGRLQAIELTPEGSGLSYQFNYDVEGKLRSVGAPSVGSEGRNVVPTIVDGKLISLRDPDGTVIGFDYQAAGAYRMRARTDRRGNTTTYEFDEVGKLASSSRHMGVDAEGVTRPPIELRFDASDRKGLPGSNGAHTFSSVEPDDVYTRFDGPRTDVRDVALFWMDRLGAPTKVRDVLGNETAIERDDPRWPGLVTKVRYPNGRVVTATYDDRGNVRTRTDSSHYEEITKGDRGSGPAVQNSMYELFAHAPGSGNPKASVGTAASRRYATTRYEWDRKWDFVTKIVPPEKDSTLMAYDPETGNRLWQQSARGPASRVEFGYNALGLLESIDGPLTEAVFLRYDALGNLRETETAKGYVTRYHRDDIGRETLVVSPIDAEGRFHARKRTVYDIMDRITLTETTGPKRVDGANSIGETWTLTVRKVYDTAGNLIRLSRSSDPDINAIGTITTRWRYDAANRQVAEVAPDGEVDSTVYDLAGNVVERHTRRGHVIVTEYDALNRRTKRTTRSVRYEEWRPPVLADWSLPKYGEGLLIPGDVATFSYDEMGNLLTANNRYARISRTYNANGTLATDTLRIRTWASVANGGDFDTHVYGIRYGYDLNGRRTWMEHPLNLAPVVDGAPQGRVEYAYNATGELQSVRDPLGNVVEYRYDDEGRIAKMLYPGEVQAEFGYDSEDGMLAARRVWGPVVNGGAAGTLHDDEYVYDARGKRVGATVYDGTVRNVYSGLGALLTVENHRTAGAFGQEHFVLDALGNRKQTWSMPREGEIANTITNYSYESGTGRLLRVEHPYLVNAVVPWTAVRGYDAAGNQDRFVKIQDHFSVTLSPIRAVAQYYDALDQLRAVDQRSCVWQKVDEICYHPLDMPYTERSVYEDYRYDALGRRILVRRRYDPDGCSFCYSSIERTVWDGDQVLYEVRYPGGVDVTGDALEKDTGPEYRAHHPYGRVAYTHGPAIDRPVSIVRMDYSSHWPDPVAVFPHTNWQGSFDIATFDDGQAERCKSFDPETCVQTDWPGDRQGVFRNLPLEQYLPPNGWLGNLTMEQRDASGQMYKRNRYYDPSTGRFTQEDPIGLAGGINLYGFAEGDPVNLTDPFGLCPKYAGGDGKTETAADCSREVLEKWASEHITLAKEATWEGVDPTLRDAIIKASIDLKLDLYISATVNGKHAQKSFHSAGHAADISRVDGVKFGLMSDDRAENLGQKVGNTALGYISSGRRAELITPLGPALRFYKEPWSADDAATLIQAHRTHVHISIR